MYRGIYINFIVIFPMHTSENKKIKYKLYNDQIN